VSSYERSLRRSIGRKIRKCAAGQPTDARPNRTNIPVESHEESKTISKLVRNNMGSSGDEFRRLVSTGKYDRCIAESRWHLKSGRKIINIVCPGYSSEPASSIVDFVINSAIHAEGTQIRNGRSDAVVNTVSVESGVNIQQYEGKNVSALESALFGEPMFNRLSPNNLVRSAYQSAIAGANEMSPSDVLSAMSRLRKNDIVYNPDNPMSYTYLCGSVGNLDVADLEKAANQKRVQWKSGANIPAAISRTINSSMADVNDTLGLSRNDTFVPYVSNSVNADSFKSLMRVASIPRRVAGDPAFESIFESAKNSGVQETEAKYLASEYVGRRSRNGLTRNLFLSNSDPAVRTAVPVTSGFLTDSPRRFRFVVNINSIMNSGQTIADVAANITSVRVRNYEFFRTAPFSISTVGSRLWIAFDENTPAYNVLSRLQGEENIDNIDIVMSTAQSDIYTEEYGEMKGDIRRRQEELGITINRGPLPNWAPDLYDYRTSIPYAVGSGNNLYQVKRAYEKRLKARRFLEEARKADEKNEGKYACAIEHVEGEIREMATFLNAAIEQYPEEVPAKVDGVPKYGVNSSTSLTRYNEEKAPWMNDEVIDRCAAEGLNVPRFGGVVNEEVVLSTLTGDEAAKFRNIVSEVRKKYGINSKTTAPSAVVVKGMDSAGRTRTGNGLVDVLPVGSGDSIELDLSQKAKDIMTRYSTSAGKNKKDQSGLFVVTETALPNKISESISIGIVYVDAFIISEDEVREYINLYTENAIAEFVSSKPEPQKLELAQAFFLPETFAMKFRSELAGMSTYKAKAFIESSVQKLFADYMSLNGDVDKVISSNELDVKNSLFTETSDRSLLEKLNVQAKVPVTKPEEYLTKQSTTWSKYMATEFGPVLSRLRNTESKIDTLCRMYDCRVVPIAASTMRGGSPKNVVNVSDKQVILARMHNGSILPSGLTGEFVTKFKDAFGGKFAVRDFDPAKDTAYPAETHNEMVSALMTTITALRGQVERIKKSVRPLFFLYGPAGSGKTIFGDVLASAFGMRYNLCNMMNVYNAGRTTMFRGQSENNLQEFFAYCRNCKNTVMVLDEFNKTYEGTERGGGDPDMSKNITAALMQTLEEDKGLYVSNSLYFVITSNKSPAWLMEHTEAEPFFSRVNQMGSQYEVDVPNDYNSLKKLFTTDAIINNTVNCMTQDTVLADIIKMMVRARMSGDNAQLETLTDKLIERNPTILDSGYVYPSEARAKYLESISMEPRERPVRDELKAKVDDFIDGLVMIKETFRAMDIKGEGKDYSDLDLICHRLASKLTWKPDSSGKIQPRAGIRDLNGLLTPMLQSHNRFLSGQEGAIPLNAQTFWHSVDLSEWVGIPDEAQDDPAVKQQRDRLGLKNNKTGSLVLQAIAADKDVGLSEGFFMSKADKKYVLEVVNEGMKNVTGGTGLSISQAQSMYKYNVLGQAISMDDGDYEAKIDEVIGLLKSGHRTSVADFATEMKRIRAYSISLMKNMRSAGMKSAKAEKAKAKAPKDSDAMAQAEASLQQADAELNAVAKRLDTVFVNIGVFIKSNMMLILEQIPDATTAYVSDYVKLSNGGWFVDVVNKFSKLVRNNLVVQLMSDASDESKIDTVLDENEKNAVEVKAREAMEKAVEINGEIFSGNMIPEMGEWAKRQATSGSDVVTVNIEDDALAEENKEALKNTAFYSKTVDTAAPQETGGTSPVAEAPVETAKPDGTETTSPVENATPVPPELPTGDFDVDPSVEDVPAKIQTPPSSAKTEVEVPPAPAEVAPTPAPAAQAPEAAAPKKKLTKEEIDDLVERTFAKRKKSSYVPMFGTRIAFAPSSATPKPVPQAVAQPVGIPAAQQSTSAPADPADVATEVSSQSYYTDPEKMSEFLKGISSAIDLLARERKQPVVESSGPFATLISI
jgi:hypothetical protein